MFLYLNYSLKNIFFQDANQLEKNILSFNESLYANTIKWNNELKSLRVRFYIIKFDYYFCLLTLKNEFQNLNQTLKIQELTNLIQNSSDKVGKIIFAKTKTKSQSFILDISYYQRITIKFRQITKAN